MTAELESSRSPVGNSATTRISGDIETSNTIATLWVALLTVAASSVVAGFTSTFPTEALGRLTHLHLGARRRGVSAAGSRRLDHSTPVHSSGAVVAGSRPRRAAQHSAECTCVVFSRGLFRQPWVGVVARVTGLPDVDHLIWSDGSLEVHPG